MWLKKVSAPVSLKVVTIKDEKGNDVPVGAIVDITIPKSSKMPGGSLSEIKAAAAALGIPENVSLLINDRKKNATYEVSANAVSANAVLHSVVRQNGRFVIKKDKKYKVSKKGDIKFKAKNADIVLMPEGAMENIVDLIKAEIMKYENTIVTADKNSGNRHAWILDNKYRNDIKKVKYSTSDKKIVNVMSDGRITLLSAGEAAIQLDITLNNGENMKLSYKLVVK